MQYIPIKLRLYGDTKSIIGLELGPRCDVVHHIYDSEPKLLVFLN
jgi:hypothetical protein